MTLLERLNYKCGSLAKAAVSRGILECPREVSKARQLLPMETAAVFHDGHKISGECGCNIRFHIGMVEARVFYLTQLGWYEATYLITWIGNRGTIVPCSKARHVQNVGFQTEFKVLCKRS
jgi:hypothetical protein